MKYNKTYVNIPKINISPSTIELMNKLNQNPHINELRERLKQMTKIDISRLNHSYSPIIEESRRINNLLSQTLYPTMQSVNQLLEPLRNSSITEFINSVAYTYQTTDAEEFEVIVENIEVPIIIIKPKIKECIKIFIDLGFSQEVAIKLAIMSFIIYKLFPIIFLLPPHIMNNFLIQVTDYFYNLGLSLERISKEKTFEFNNPDYTAEFLIDQAQGNLFAFIINLFK